MTERDLFMAALEIADPADRAAFLDRECAGDRDLRDRVDALLGAHTASGAFMDRPAAGVSLTGPDSAAALVGTRVGPYKLLQVIGEGGFGVVYMAEQERPVFRRVALKVIKPGMDSKTVLARFEAERQALALMDHANIARVLDAGETDSGRSYFVMELVRGVPITDYCDQSHLPPRDRLELFAQVCQAVQHAHQKGVIHRDLKPSNVLVSAHDGRPAVKVIDFGVAKATGQRLTDKTLFTGFAQMVGTPLYMSPEQAAQSPDIDTRADIYALGVLLYELLTGTTPITRERLNQAAYDEIQRIIREEDPPKPSTRLSESKDSLPSISALRDTEPAKLTRLVRGELDWIAMKALEKDRNRRYESAAGFALDVQRYLAGEPVLAVPPSAGYRVRKFLRRNRRAVAAAGLVLLALVVGVVGTTAGMLRARSAEREAAGDRDRAEKERDAAVAARKETFGALLDLTDSTVQDLLVRTWTATPTEREFLERVIARFDRLTADTPDTGEAQALRARALHQVGRVYLFLGDFARAADAAGRAADIYRALRSGSPDDPELAGRRVTCLIDQSVARARLGDRTAAGRIETEAVALAEAAHRQFPDHDLIALGLSHGYRNRAATRWDDPTARLADLDRAIPLAEAVLGRHPAGRARAQALVALTQALAARAAHHAARGDVEAVRRDTTRVDAVDHADRPLPAVTRARAACYRVLGQALARARQPGPAAEASRQSVRMLEMLADQHPGDATLRASLIDAYKVLQTRLQAVGQWEEAHRYHRTILALLERSGVREESAQVYGALAERWATEAQDARVNRRTVEANQALDRAVSHARRSIELSDGAPAADRPPARAQAGWWRAVCQQANALQRRPDAIEFARRQADAAHAATVAGQKPDADLLELLLSGNRVLAVALAASGRAAEAVPAWEEMARVVAWSDSSGMNNVAWGQLAELTGQLAAAGAALDPSAVLGPGLADREARLRAESGVTAVRIDLRRGYRILGLLCEKLRLYRAGEEAFDRAIKLAPVPREAPVKDVRDERYLVYASLIGRAVCLDAMEREADAEAAWNAMRAHEPSAANSWAPTRYVALVRNGQTGRAMRLAKERFPVSGDIGLLHYIAACFMATASTGPALAPERREELAARAVEQLDRARGSDFFKDPANLRHARTDPDLAPIRERADFRRLFADPPVERGPPPRVAKS